MAVLKVETNNITGIDACDNVCQVTFKTNVIVFIVYIMCLIISHCPMI